MKKPRIPLNTLNVIPDKVAIVHGGGGATGIWGIGPLMAIEDEKIPIAKGWGVSVGGINLASFFSHGCKTEFLAENWLRIRRSSEVFDYQNALYFIYKLGMPSSIYQLDPLIKLVCRLDEDKLINQSSEFVAVTTRVPHFIPVYFSTHDEEIRREPLKILMANVASCAFPGAFPAIPIHFRGEWGLYIDGAYRRPLPIKKAIESGCNTIIVIRCHSNELLKSHSGVWLNGNWMETLAEGLSGIHNGQEKDEITAMQELGVPLNLFILEPPHLSKNIGTVSFGKPSERVRTMLAGKEYSQKKLKPLADYYQKLRA